MTWRAGDKLGLDIGDVMSRRSKYNTPAWQTADHDCYPFVVLFGAKYGLADMHIISRTNRGVAYNNNGSDVWVTRFIRQLGVFNMGMPEENLHVVRQAEDKGNVVLNANLMGFVDNDAECLDSIMRRSQGTVLFHYSNNADHARRFVGRHAHLNNHVKHITSWFELANDIGLPQDRELWDSIGSNGPPCRQHDPEPQHALYDAFDVLFLKCFLFFKCFLGRLYFQIRSI